eukprot:g4966.t1
MVRVLDAVLFVVLFVMNTPLFHAAFEDKSYCCYQGCTNAPLGCNQPTDYCSKSQENCEDDCKGTFCPATPSPTPTPTPTPSPPPSPTPTPSSDLWCPSSSDFVITYTGGDGSSKVTLQDQGYEIHGAGGVATKAAYNMIDGYVEYDVDFSTVNTGVNANVYSISPKNIDGTGYVKDDYCDGADNSSPWCVEVDFVESNGNCGGATTLHTVEGPGSNGCTSWGCRFDYHYKGKSSFHMRVDFAVDGTWTTTRDGVVISGSMMSPQPGASDWQTIKGAYESQGAVIYSSEWTGWVPVSDCGTSGDLSSSHFAVSNMKIKGKVVQGPPPAACGATRVVERIAEETSAAKLRTRPHPEEARAPIFPYGALRSVFGYPF